MNTEQFAMGVAFGFSLMVAAAFGFVVGRLKSKGVINEKGMRYSMGYDDKLL